MYGQLKYLKCQIANGMFSNEYSVEIEDGESQYSLFVEKDKVKNGNGNNGLIKVFLLQTEGGFGTVSLPSETLGNGFNTIRVPLTMLQEA